MRVGARTPEELETLLEDAFVLRDPRSLSQLFEAAAMLVVGGGSQEARGGEEIARLATQIWDLEHPYLVEQRRILQVRETALVLEPYAINVARRGDDGSWRYTISVLGSS